MCNRDDKCALIVDAKQQAAFLEKAKALAPKYGTEFLAKA
jgi:hypothetical protein